MATQRVAKKKGVKRTVSKKTTKLKQSNHVGGFAVFGAALVALGATAYYFFGPGGNDHQKKARGWAIKMKGEVVHRLEKLKKIDEPLYHEIVDAVAKEFEQTKVASRAEVASLASTMKRAWDSIVLQASKSGKKRS